LLVAFDFTALTEGQMMPTLLDKPRTGHRARALARFAIGATVVGLMAGCATQQPPSQHTAAGQPIYGNYTQYGEIVGIDQIRTEGRSSGVGAILGGIAGAVIGNQFGSHGGRAAMTGLGAVGGVVAGDQIEKRRNGGQAGAWRFTVRLSDGNVRTFDYEQPGDLRVGDRVRVEEGRIYRY